MTYALPWRYSTTELKGHDWIHFSIDRYVFSVYTYYIYRSYTL